MYHACSCRQADRDQRVPAVNQARYSVYSLVNDLERCQDVSIPRLPRSQSCVCEFLVVTDVATSGKFCIRQKAQHLAIDHLEEWPHSIHVTYKPTSLKPGDLYYMLYHVSIRCTTPTRLYTSRVNIYLLTKHIICKGLPALRRAATSCNGTSVHDP